MSSNFIDKNGRQSKGVLLLRTLAMPSDTNANGDIFGGWIMSQMDMGGAILAKEIAHGRVVTVAVESMNFIKPIAVGDVVCCYGQCLKIGRSSIQIKVEVWVKKVASEPIGERYCVTDAVFTFVAVDNKGKSRAIPREGNEELEKALALIQEYENQQTKNT
ncbi:acyl-CoA thioester hydrolase YciA [Rodentibacter pneumotropicus]|uniref:Acyl-CoA thioester hydrolase YciA n=1 Tax=Rodentibacter pneumotropicus TaxID=758 RepID=A0A3S5ES22_9PAST|nr:acyl-CoA thioester hydrolase YciA [Rodentibacter pneumotropicus]MDC2825215.1 acyl-CoA thioester hydrolase YciA [Rodentibacter pneumotropicus]NBH74473.1 acyl-CoA thioester hydrolase YciA [Rodentibacter pneumotropicus]OOF62553.1 acyl-CoA thioesterase [Rodentibacter pneumotropicus]THA01479.1 acyl-CoA thioester hydrolase YciA [Rodentibacter pneumotropicus]THA02880.1 acyl-CoA thioester hydrolase YciA [Rodentibacter pneumotropicus]